MKKIYIIAIVFIVVAIGAGFFAMRKRTSTISQQPSLEELSQKSEVSSEVPRAEIESQETVSENSEQSKENTTEKKEGISAQDKQQSPPKTTDEKNETTSDSYPTLSRLISWGFESASNRTIKAIIIHTSYNALGGDLFSVNGVLKEWKDAGVAPHYLIDRAGTIYHLIDDKNIAYHAGVSKLPDGTTDVNGASIGIEVINTQDGKFSDVQYSALNRLIGDLKKKYAIKYVLGHDDIAPGRKTDPWGINWDEVKR